MTNRIVYLLCILTSAVLFGFFFEGVLTSLTTCFLPLVAGLFWFIGATFREDRDQTAKVGKGLDAAQKNQRSIQKNQRSIERLLGTMKRDSWSSVSIKTTSTPSALVNWPVGQKALIRTNQPEPLVIATVVGHEDVHGTLWPLFEDAQGTQFTTGAITVYYYPERKAALDKLTWWEQWNVMGQWANICTEEYAKRREGTKLAKEEKNEA